MIAVISFSCNQKDPDFQNPFSDGELITLERSVLKDASINAAYIALGRPEVSLDIAEGQGFALTGDYLTVTASENTRRSGIITTGGI